MGWSGVAYVGVFNKKYFGSIFRDG